ncbi:hypothetical protein [Uliginosibacterium sediminicola]|uniref:Phage protein n=1 Tax=Uliginosibacterium sediminicola TaxID=2024550 RepID=A0ABU9YYG4_9RHOO
MTVKIMNMMTGEQLSDMERYGEEVLNANWLPQQVLSVGLQLVSSAVRATPPALQDIDDFMSRLYRSQE